MARKKTKKNRKRRKKVRPQTQARLSPKMRQSMKERGIESPIIVRSPGSEKMSEVLPAFAEPLLEYVSDDRPGFEKAISIAAFAWNLSLLPEEEWESQIDDIAHEISQSDDEIRMVTSMIQMLVQRRIQLFADITRFICDFEILDQKNGWHLNVVSTLE